jgi:hypothetical protein
MTIWTIKPLNVYEELLEQGIFRCDPANENFWGVISEEFKYAYDWLVKQMKIKVGIPPKDVLYPIWAWALIDGINKKPDLRRTEFNNYAGENVVLELEIPDSDLLLSDEVNWHYCLNNWYLHGENNKEFDEAKWEEAEVWFDNLPSDKKQSIKFKSWERILDKNDKINDWKFVQATFWELREEQIKSVRRFTGRKK